MSEKCCGNCKHFKDEGIDGFGFCVVFKCIHHCTGGGRCCAHQFNDNGWTELTPDNVDDINADLIVVTDGTYYKMANDWRTSLSTLANVGGCYYYVLPELKIERNEQADTN